MFVVVNYWPCVGKLADTLELSYLEAQHRMREEAETLSAFAGLSVMSNTTPVNCIQLVTLILINSL
jgi:hypothetical protein